MVNEIINANKIIESILRFIDIKRFLFQIYKNEKHIILVLFPEYYGTLITWYFVINLFNGEILYYKITFDT